MLYIKINKQKYDNLLLLNTLVTKITKLRCAAKSAYCVEVVSFLAILKGRDVSDQMVNIPEDKAQSPHQVQLNINNVVNEFVCTRQGHILECPGGGAFFLEGGGGPKVTENIHFYY